MKKRLASVNLKTKKIHLDPAVGGSDRAHLTTHMRTYLHHRLPRSKGGLGESFSKSVAAANKAERANMTEKGWLSYNGRLGAIARWHSTKNTVRVRRKK